MTPIDGAPIVSADAMRGAEQAAAAAGTPLDTLMARAGAGIADWVRRLGAGREMLFLCGPGNSGGDGYVAARLLAAEGRQVRVAAAEPPRTALAVAAHAAWGSPVQPLAAAAPAPLLVDCLFGTGLTRPPDPDIAERLATFVAASAISVAVDLPSGLDADGAQPAGPVPRFDVTLALGALKPAHLLYPGAAHCGTVRLVPLGIDIDSRASVLAAPRLPTPGPDAHKFTRGMVVVIGGVMPGAAALAAEAALRSGAGYVLGLDCIGGPLAVVRRRFDAAALEDRRIGAVLIGPGLGRDDAARAKLDAALASAHPLVIDGDALQMLDPADLPVRRTPVVLTPHAGEFAALFGDLPGNKIDRARAAAQASSAVVVFKGADTVIAAPDGRVRVATGGSGWLSTAGTGDVLAGAVTALLSGGRDPLAAAEGGVWMHNAAARRLGNTFIADDLPQAMAQVRADR